MPVPEDLGVLTERGFLRVDRAKALEKLATFGFESPDSFLLAWARAAAASGAVVFEADAGDGIRLSFDGAPFSRACMNDPYSALFEECSRAPGRQLALGLLACLRTGPESVVVESGPPGHRLRLVVKGLGDDVLEAAAGDGRTSIQVRWGAGGEDRSRASLNVLAAALDFSRKYRVSGISASPPPGPVHRFKSGEAQVTVCPRFGRTPFSEVVLCHHAVRVQSIESLLPPAPVRAWVDDPRFTLNASQSVVVEDDVLRAAFDAAVRGSLELVGIASAAVAAPDSPGPESGRRWLRIAVGLCKDASGEGALGSLRGAPLFDDAGGGRLSIDDIAAHYEGVGRILFSRKPAAGPLPWPVVLCPDEEGPSALEGRFGRSVVDVTGLVEADAAARRVFNNG